MNGKDTYLFLYIPRERNTCGYKYLAGDVLGRDLSDDI